MSQLENKKDNNVNQQVENPSLVASIDVHHKQQSTESAAALIQELRSAHFLAPMDPTELGLHEGLTQDESKLAVALMTTDDGSVLLPLFTDLEHFSKNAPEMSGLVLEAMDAYAFAISSEFDGVVINPGGKALPVNSDMLAHILAGDEDEE